MVLKKHIKTATKSLFQKRSVIVMSTGGTHHVSLSARAQLGMFASLIALVGAGSYSTGKYMAARETLAAQDETLNTLANSHVQNSFNFLPPTLASNERMATAATAPGESSFVGLSAMDQNKLMARVAYLEGRERELMKQNETIIATVREKVSDQIAGLENVIRNTGLEPSAIVKVKPSKDPLEDAALTAPSTGAKGGPFISQRAAQADEIKRFEYEMSRHVRRIDALKNALNTIPLVAPVAKASFESPFGGRVDPFSGRMAFHSGVDLAAPYGSNVFATSSGKITIAEYRGAYGNLVEIDHGLGLTTRYGHLSSINVTVGQEISKGEKLGVQGSTGRSTGPHVHYEIRMNDRPMNPSKFLSAGKQYVSQNAQ